MLMQASARRKVSAHVIVVGNEKGGTGKSTLTMHLSVALMNFGQRVATIDLDSRQKTFTHYVENRRGWAKRCGGRLKVPMHFCVSSGSTRKLDENEAIEFTRFADALSSIERAYDFLVIDTPGTDNHLTRLAHSMADTLITPINDSYVDFDVLGRVDPTTFTVTGESHYAQMVREARLQRRLVDGARMDWVVMRNRLSLIDSGNKERISKGLAEMATRIGFRVAEGLAERVVYREFFPRGLTALDDLDDETLGISRSASHVAARQEVTALMEMIKLPLDERGRERAAAQAKWIVARSEPLEVHDVIAE
ncbi:MAG TPA: division plane positioning ATPase MipZ [Xanthobacteraceae bacterium]|jgi:chromosome partitioning protein|nr:division plane positioning ATPase MipZ [Xanthobacteraceae bacterium]